jgi:anthranilate synthase/aminodeoxychorismate synthase-like glutamine amidotransferase
MLRLDQALGQAEEALTYRRPPSPWWDRLVFAEPISVLDDLVRAAGDGEFTHLVISPGPGAPAEAGISVEAAKALGPSVPVLGVCLGHQAIAEAYGARVVRARRIVHGKPSLLHHAGKGLFRGLPSPVSCARYHSLVVSDDGLPGELEVTARTASGTIMGLRHR